MVEVQYIDRRKCHRVVPMRVLCLGASRTGTESMRKALQQLGYNETYHGFAPAFESPLDNIMWREAVDAKFNGKGKPYGRKEWDQLLGHCQAVTDAPAMCFGPELIEAYPEAKIILTLRDVDSWYQSFLTAAVIPFYRPAGTVVCFILDLTRSPFRHSHSSWDIIFRKFWLVNPSSPGGLDASAAKGVYVRHQESIRALAPKGNLLEFRVQDGWEPLCAFLGEDVPAGEFPSGNAKEELAERIRLFGREAGKLLLMRIGQVAAVVGVVWWAGRAGVWPF